MPLNTLIQRLVLSALCLACRGRPLLVPVPPRRSNRNRNWNRKVGDSVAFELGQVEVKEEIQFEKWQKNFALFETEEGGEDKNIQ